MAEFGAHVHSGRPWPGPPSHPLPQTTHERPRVPSQPTPSTLLNPNPHHTTPSYVSDHTLPILTHPPQPQGRHKRPLTNLQKPVTIPYPVYPPLSHSKQI